MTHESPKILLTGVTGFIGGSVLSRLFQSDHPAIRQNPITCLLRGDADRIAKLKAAYGDRVSPIIYKDIDDAETSAAVASEHDIVINTTIGWHANSGQSLVQGLAKRKQVTSRPVFLINTSGTSNIAEHVISRRYVESDPHRQFDDSRDDMYAYEKMRNELEPYHQRTAELGVIDAGELHGVTVVTMMPPTIYGVGSGLFNKHSIQVACYVQGALAAGHGVYIDEGKGSLDHVHIDDLIDLYALVLENILDNSARDLPTGKSGVIFAGAGRHTWKEVAHGVASAAFKAGALNTPDARSVSLQEGAHYLCDGNTFGAEANLSDHALTKANVAHKLGWRPKRGEEDWERGFAEEVADAIAKDKTNVNKISQAY